MHYFVLYHMTVVLSENFGRIRSRHLFLEFETDILDLFKFSGDYIDCIIILTVGIFILLSAMSSTSIGQLMADMRELMINLQIRERAMDSALAKSQIVNDKICGMKEVRKLFQKCFITNLDIKME